MSKISIYEVAPVPKLADKLVGTSVGGDPEDITYNFTLSELLNLFIPNIPGNTLQGVLDFGNTATQNINLTGIITTTTLNVGSTANILNSNLTGQTHITGGLYDRLNSIGTAGQVLTSTGTQVEWYTIPTVIPDLQQVLAAGNTAVNNIILTGNLSANNAALLTSTISTSLTLLGTLRDGLSSVGANNQVLSSNVSGVRWVNLPVYSATSPLLYNSGTGVFSIQQANASQDGYLSSADWITFDGKQTAISLTTTGNSGPSTLVGATINVPNYTLSGLGGVPQTRTLTINGVTFNLSADRTWTIATGVSSVSATTPLFSTGGANPDISIQQSSSSLDGYLSSTDWLTFNSKEPFITAGTTLQYFRGDKTFQTLNTTVVPEGTNLYYLDSRARAAVSLTTIGSSGASTYNSTTGVFNIPDYGSVLTGYVPTSRTLNINGISYDLSADRSWSVGTVTSVAALTIGTTGTDLSSSVATNTTTPVITLNVPTASAVNRGALSAADWTTFNNKVGSVTATSPLFSSGGSTPNITIQQSSGSQDGYLSSTDWTTFNNKQAAGNYITSLTGEATATGPGAAAVTLDNASVTGKILTGVNITGGTVLATDTMLIGFGKLQNQINGLIGGSLYQGTWNASTNTPTLTSSVGTQGYYYIVSVAGTTNLDGITDWNIGDWAIFNGGVWQQVDNTDAVVSVNGQTGAVSLTTDNITEGVTNLYYTDTRARAALSFTAGSGAYNSSTGVITIPTNTSQLTNGANFITLASLSGTAPISYNSGTGAISITQSGAASDGYLSSTDWNTFNNKQNALTNPVLASGSWTSNYIPKINGTYTLTNSLLYDGGSSIGVNTNAPHDSAQFKLDVNGGLLIKNTSGTIAQLILINSDPAAGGNNGFVQFIAGGNTATTFAELQTYYGLAIASGALRLQPTAGQVLVGTTTTSAFMVDINGTLRATGQLTLGSTITNGTYTYTLPGATGTLALVGGSGVGTVTSVAALTLGTTGTDLSSTVANSTTTPVITLNVPTASATNRGALSSADWTTFNNKQNALTNPVTGTGTTNTLPKFTGASAIGDSNITDTGSLITLGSNTTISSGGLGIGSTSLTQYGLRISKNITGSTTAYGMSIDGVIQSDATSNVSIYNSQLNTQAASFTLTNLYHYAAGLGTIGAGSTVTNQSGYFVSSAMTGATNNFGFRGSLASAANTWNLYMGGTAANYMAGSLGIGTTNLTGYSLRLSKSIIGAATSFGIVNDGAIESGVTNGIYYRTTAAIGVGVSLSLLYHYQASSGTFVGTVTDQIGFEVSTNLVNGTNNYGFRGQIPSGTNRWNLYMSGTADNFIAGNTGIGVGASIVSSGPILTTTLTSGGSGYVDATYTDVASTVVSGGGTYALFTIVVSGGIVTTATLTWGGSTYTAGTTLTVSNTLLGGTGSGLVITVNTVDSSQLYVASATGGDINLFRSDTASIATDNIGSIKWNGNDGSAKASGLQAKIGAFAAGTTGGAYLSFETRSATAGTSLVEAMRIDSRGNVGIGATALTRTSLAVSKNITGSTISIGIASSGVIQSDVTSQGYYFISESSTAAASFTLGNIYHYRATQGTFGAGSIVTNQSGFNVDNLTGATNNYGFFGNIASGTNRWNLFMNGTANNYMAGSLGIGTTSLTGYTLRTSKNITGATTCYGVTSEGAIQSDVTSSARMFWTLPTIPSGSAVTDVYHYITGQGLFTGTLTNQYGFVASSSLTGGTNNFGFWGNIPSGTNRWNLYMTGTAANYMAGKLLIGSTTDNGEQLQITGTSRFIGNMSISGSSSTANADIRQIGFINTSNSANVKASIVAVNGADSDDMSLSFRTSTSAVNISERLRIAGNGGVGVNTGASINASAQLQVDSTTKGFLPPRMTLAQRTAIASPATGLIVYQTDGTEGVYVYTSIGWKSLTMV